MPSRHILIKLYIVYNNESNDLSGIISNICDSWTVFHNFYSLKISVSYLLPSFFFLLHDKTGYLLFSVAFSVCCGFVKYSAPSLQLGDDGLAKKHHMDTGWIWILMYLVVWWMFCSSNKLYRVGIKNKKLKVVYLSLALIGNERQLFSFILRPVCLYLRSFSKNWPDKNGSFFRWSILTQITSFLTLYMENQSKIKALIWFFVRYLIFSIVRLFFLSQKNFFSPAFPFFLFVYRKKEWKKSIVTNLWSLMVDKIWGRCRVRVKWYVS